MERNFLVTVTHREGERELDLKVLTTVDTAEKDVEKVGEQIMCEHYGLKEENKEDYYYWNSSMECVYFVHETKEVPQEEFEVLKKYF